MDSEDDLAGYNGIQFESRKSIYGLYATHLDYHSSSSAPSSENQPQDENHANENPPNQQNSVSVHSNNFFDNLLSNKNNGSHSNAMHYALETDNLLQKDCRKDMQGRELHEKVMRNFNYHRSSLSNIHIWWMVFVKSLNHLMRKYFEYFAYFLILPSSYLAIDSFFTFGICIASMDLAFILCQIFILPFTHTYNITDINSSFFLNYYSPHHLQFFYQSLIALSMFTMLWWNTFAGIFILRFIFGIGYCLLLNNWSVCISLFISPSKQSSAVGKMELSWAFASFCFILVAYIMDAGGFNIVLYIFCISSVICSIVLLSVMPSAKLSNAITANANNDNIIGVHQQQSQYILGLQQPPPQPYLSTIKEHLKVLFSFIFGMGGTDEQKYVCMIYLLSMALITFVNTMLTLLLAVWLTTDYYLSITEFGYCTVIIGTAQLVSILFSYQYRHKLGIGWSLLAGIIVQLLMFAVLLIFHNNGILSEWMYSDSYTFPLLLMLLILCIHFIAAEFTYINAVSAMIHFAPLNVSVIVASQSLKIVISVGRILGAVFSAWIWYWGKFHLFVELGCICLGIAFCLYLVIMVYVACCSRMEQMIDGSVFEDMDVDVGDVQESSDLPMYFGLGFQLGDEMGSVVSSTVFSRESDVDSIGRLGNRARILQRNRDEEKRIRFQNQAIIIDEIDRGVNMDVRMDDLKNGGRGKRNTTEIYMKRMMDASRDLNTANVKIL